MPDRSSDEPADSPSPPPYHRRRRRYRGTHPRRFEDRYKELAPQQYPEIVDQVRARGGTPAGTHVPILRDEVLQVLRPAAGDVVADCTLGYGGHAAEFLLRVGPTGRLLGFDLDREQLERTGERLRSGFPNHSIELYHMNYAGLAKALTASGGAVAVGPSAEPAAEPEQTRPMPAGYDVIFADLGVSSIQVDDPSRGFSYKNPGPLDMRMDRARRRTAADVLALIGERELATALADFGDEPDAARIARAIVEQRSHGAIGHTNELVRVILEAKGFSPARWRAERLQREGAATGRAERFPHPAARTFQALRILVNDELGSLAQLLRVAPYCLTPGGRIGIITFHSGEDRLVERALREGMDSGVYEEIAGEPIRPSRQEQYDNPRSRSARLRWARRARALAPGA